MAQVQPTRRAEHAPDELAFKIAADQWGHISRRQALECGLTRRQIQQRTTRGGWKTVHPGVYRLPGAPVSWKGRVQAALLWAGPDALLCGRTAAYLLGLEGIEQPHDIDILTTASTPYPECGSTGGGLAPRDVATQVGSPLAKSNRSSSR